MSKSKKSSLSKLGDKIMSADHYGETAKFNINGQESYPSVVGTIISLLIFAVVIAYGLNKFIIMWEFNDTKHQTVTLENEIA